MVKYFPEPITKLPIADIQVEGLTAYISQSDSHQILFMEFEKDAELPLHSHDSQVGFVLEGKMEITINGKTDIYMKGSHYYIPKGVEHSVKIYAGYKDITFFNESDRYTSKRT